MTDYTYSASGAKLSVTYTNGATTTTNQHCGNMLYEQIREPSPDLTVQSALSAAGKNPGTPNGISFSPFTDNAVPITDYLIRSKVPNHIYRQIKATNRGEVIKPRK